MVVGSATRQRVQQSYILSHILFLFCRSRSPIRPPKAVGSPQVAGIPSQRLAWGDIKHVYIRNKTGVATTRRPQAVRCNIACRWIRISCIYGDGGNIERVLRYLLFPGPRSSNRSHFLAFANLPSGAPGIPGSLLLDASTWTNVLGNVWPL